MATFSEQHLEAGRVRSRGPVIGIGLIVLACLCFSILDATAKYLSASLPPLQIAWVRFVSHLILALVFFRVWQAPHLLTTKRPGLQILRACCLLLNTMFNFLAVQHLQLAETMSILFAAPLVITAFAGPFLGEWAGPRRWAAIMVGFAGVLVVTQPGTGPMNWAVLYSLASMVCYAIYALLTRKLSDTESSAGLLIISGLVASLALAPAGLSVWVMPGDSFTWMLLIGTGVLGGGGHFLLILAYRYASAPALAPFIYVQIIWMIGLGYLVFGDIPNVMTLTGAAIVVASGLYILYREHVRRH